MKCNVNLHKLSLYMDERLEAKEAEELKAHVQECDRCQKRLKTLQESGQLLGMLTPIEESPDFDTQFHRKLEERIERIPSFADLVLVPVKRTTEFVRHNAAVMATSAVALIIALSFTFYQIGGELPKVTATFGEVEIFDKKQNKTVLAKVGMKLRGDEVIKTGAAGEIDIELKQRYHVRLKPESELTAMKLVRHRKLGTTQFKLARGTIFANVEKQPRDSQFKVLTPVAEATVKGTSFWAFYNSATKIMNLLVKEGKVSMAKSIVDAAGKVIKVTRTVGPGQQISASQTQLGKVKKAPKTETERLKEELKRKDAIIRALRAKIKELLQIKIKELEDRIEVLEEETEREPVVAFIRVPREELDRLRAKVDELRTSEEGLRRQIKMREEEAATRETKHAAIIESHVETIGSLEDQLAEKDETIKGLQAMIDALETGEEKADKQIETLEKKVAALAAERDAMKKRIDKLLGIIKDLKSRLGIPEIKPVETMELDEEEED